MCYHIARRDESPFTDHHHCPITSQSKPYPSRISITLQASGKSTTSWIILDQIRTIDRIRITKTLGKLIDSEIAQVKVTIKEIFVD